MDSLWKEFTEFETSQVLKLEVNEEEKKALVKQHLLPYIDAHTKALKMFSLS